MSTIFGKWLTDTIVVKQEAEKELKDKQSKEVTTNELKLATESSSKDIRGLASTDKLYTILKNFNKAAIDQKSKTYARIYKYLATLKPFFIFCYICWGQYLDTPGWCLEKLKESENFQRGSIELDCHGFDVPYSNVICLSPVVIFCLDTVCLFYFCILQLLKYKW